MRRFSALYRELDATTSTTDKVDALARYLESAPPADGAWAVALLTGHRPKATTSSTALRDLALETTGLPAWLFRECRAAVGDLSETVALLIPASESAHADESLDQTMQQRVLPLACATDAERKRLIEDAWRALPPDHRLVYHKLLRGGFRVGVQRKLVARAIAKVAGVDAAVVQHRLAGGFDPTPDAYRALLAPAGAADERARPYPFFLARQLDDAPDTLGDRDDWICEWKWDGVRAQLARRVGQTSLWSRGEDIITHQFPEIAAAGARLPDGTALDGEILIWRDDRPRPFAELQTRLNRKTAPTLQPGLFDQDRAVFLAFDLLERAGKDIRERPQRERLRALDDVVGALDDDTIRRSKPVDARTWQGLADLRKTSRERAVEGLVLKHADSPYGVGRTKPAIGGGWWKWKIDPYTVDCVLIHAFPGSGRRASLYTDYGFAVWRDTDNARELVPFTRAYSGLNQYEIESLDRWIRSNTTRRSGPVREVAPERVFEIAFEGIARSKRHKAGVALRFPRILRERTDKRPDDANTLASLEALLETDPGERP